MSNNLIEYIKIHKISLEQDLQNPLVDKEFDNLTGQITALSHIIEVAEELQKGK